jgi:hypothetical protein
VGMISGDAVDFTHGGRPEGAKEYFCSAIGIYDLTRQGGL